MKDGIEQALNEAEKRSKMCCIFCNYYQSPRERELDYIDDKGNPPKGWHKINVFVDEAIASFFDYGHETGLSEAIIFRRIFTSVFNWERVKYRRFHKRRRDYPSPPLGLSSLLCFPRWRQATLYLTSSELKKLLACAKRKRVAPDEIVNSVCAEHFRPDRKWKWRNMK